MFLKRAADDDAQSRQHLWCTGFRAFFFLLHLESRGSETLHKFAVVLIAEIVHNALPNDRTDARNGLQFFLSGFAQRIHGLEMFRQCLRCHFSHEADAQGKDHFVEGLLLALLNAAQHVHR